MRVNYNFYVSHLCMCLSVYVCLRVYVSCYISICIYCVYCLFIYRSIVYLPNYHSLCIIYIKLLLKKNTHTFCSNGCHLNHYIQAQRPALPHTFRNVPGIFMFPDRTLEDVTLTCLTTSLSTKNRTKEGQRNIQS